MVFKKGMIPWNKGTKGVMKPNKTSFKKGKKAKNWNGFNKGDNIGEDHHNWKGDNASYIAFHQWIYRHKGKATKCEKCDSIEDVEWANKSHEYKRELNDWIQLCTKCHGKYDAGRSDKKKKWHK